MIHDLILSSQRRPIFLERASCVPASIMSQLSLLRLACSNKKLYIPTVAGETRVCVCILSVRMCAHTHTHTGAKVRFGERGIIRRGYADRFSLSSSFGTRESRRDTHRGQPCTTCRVLVQTPFAFDRGLNLSLILSRRMINNKSAR